MKKFAKLMSVALALMLVFSALACVSAATVDEVLGISADASSVNEKGEVAVTVKAIADYDYTNIEFEVTYDKSNFTVGTCVDGTAIGKYQTSDDSKINNLSAINITSESVKVVSAISTPKSVKAGDVLVTITFIAKEGVAKTADVTGINFGLKVNKFNNNGTAVAGAAQTAPSVSVTIRHEHDYVTLNESESVAPECEKDGFDRYYCLCGEYEDRPVDMTGHNYSEEWLPVEGEDNWYQITCGSCSAPIKSYLPADASDADLGVTVSAPKGAFTEKVSIVIDKEKATFEDKIKASLSDDVTDLYMFDVRVVNEQGETVEPAAGTELSITFVMPDEYVGNMSAIGFCGTNDNAVETLFEGVALKNITVNFSSSGTLAVVGVIPTDSSDSSEPSGSTDSSDTASKDQEDVSSKPLISKPSSTVEKTDSTSSEKPATTGDTSVIWVAVLAALVAVLALALTFVLGKKKHS